MAAGNGREIDHTPGATPPEPAGLHHQLDRIPFAEQRHLYAQLRPHAGHDRVAQANDNSPPERTTPTAAECQEPVTVGGKTYRDRLTIPGNEPVALNYADGKPVRGPNGEPVYGPSRANLDKVARELGQNPFVVTKFGHRGEYDFQRMNDDKGNEVFTEKYRDFANIAIGYAFAANGKTWKDAASTANLYCTFTTCDFPEKDRTQQYPRLSSRQVEDYKIGEELYRSRHPK